MSSLYDIYVVDFCHSPTAMTRTKYYDVDDNDDDENNADGHGHQKVSVDGEWLCLKELQELGENDHHRHYHYYQRTLALLSINIGQTEYIPQSLPKIGQENTIIIIIITI